MSEETLHIHLKMSSDIEFFNALEKSVEIRMPLQLKNILKLNCYDSAVALSRFDDNSVREVEQFMRNGLTATMLKKNESLSDYLGIFSHDQTKFKILSGLKSTIKVISEHCSALYPPQVSDNVLPLPSMSPQQISPILPNQSMLFDVV